jgi:O-acetyl-ADP-ribose deacetylase (regulator of RNase III)
MIKIIDGDLLSSNADIIAHQVNCSNAMNSGVAKQIRGKYPEVFKAYQSLCKPRFNCKHTLLGDCQVVETHDGKCIANLFGQLGYGYDGQQYTDLDALKRAMLKLRSRCELSITPEKITIAFPYGLGSVRGGAKWEDVYTIIEEVFDGYNVEIWRLDKG